MNFILLTGGKTLTGAVIALLGAMAAAIPILLRLYYRDKRAKEKQKHIEEKIRLKSNAQLERKKLALEEKKLKQENALEQKQLKQQAALEKEKIKQQAAIEEMKVKQEVKKEPESEKKKPELISPVVKTLLPSVDIDLFKKKAVRLGCKEDMPIEDMAKRVLQLAPEFTLKELPEDMPDEEKAMRLLGAFKTSEVQNAN